MFDLVRKFAHRESPTAHEPLPIRLLAVTENADAWKLLSEIADQNGWELFWANSCEAALAVLSEYVIPIVICDRDLPHAEWRSVVKRISVFRESICILLASPVSDEYLWRELVQHQGFDVLPKPFQKERVVRLVNQARSWGGR